MSGSTERPATRDEISARIAAEAWKDEAFRKRVLSNPDAVFEEKTGNKLPAGVHIKVLEDDAHTVHFVIPAKPARAAELSDSDLEAVAGGGKGQIISDIITTITDVTSILSSVVPSPKKW